MSRTFSLVLISAISAAPACKCTFARTGRHQLVELRVLRESVHKWHQRTSVFDESAAGICIRDEAHLLLRDIEQLGKLFSVGCRLIQHDDEFRVGQHRAGLYGIQQVFHVLRDGGGIGIALSELSPRRVEELGREFVLKYNVEFVEEDMCALALLPVERDPVQHHAFSAPP